MKSVVLGFAGRIASGKTTISRASANALNLPWVSFGNYVRHVTNYIGLDTDDRIVLQDVGNFLSRYPEAFCTKVLEQVGYKSGTGLVIDGIRHKEIADELRSLASPAPFILIYLSASDDTIERRRQEYPRNSHDINDIEQDPTEVQVKNVLAPLADIRINNEGRSIEDVLSEIIQALSLYIKQL